MSRSSPRYPDAFWDNRLGKEFRSLEDEDKHYLAFSLLGYLDVVSLKFFEFFFTSDDYHVRCRAGTFMAYDTRKKDEARRFAPAVLFKAWHEKFPSARPHLHAMIYGCAKEIALEESNSIIRDKSLKIRTSELTQDTFEETLTPGKLVETYRTHAPFVWSLLEVFASSPNAYRKRMAKTASRTTESAEGANGGRAEEISEDPVAEEGDIDEDDEDEDAEMDDHSIDPEVLDHEDGIGAAFTGGQGTPPGFSRNPMFVSTHASVVE